MESKSRVDRNSCDFAGAASTSRSHKQLSKRQAHEINFSRKGTAQKENRDTKRTTAEELTNRVSEIDLSECTASEACDEHRRYTNSSATSKVVTGQCFDYLKFQKFLKLQKELERRLRLEALKCGASVAQLKHFTDDILTEEMRGIYGPLDMNSDQFQILFKTFKEQRLTQLQTWIAEENLLAKNGTLKRYARSNPPINIRKELELNYTEEELMLYDLNPFTNTYEHEWFIMPRPELPVEMFDLSTSEEIEILMRTNQEKPQNQKEIIRKGINLTVFDPKFKFPESILPNKGIGLQLCRTMKRQMDNKYSLGISIGGFFQQYKDEYNYAVQFESFGLSTYTDMVLALDDVFFLQTMKRASEELLFPSYFKGIICPLQDLFWRIWHRLQFLHGFFDGKITDAKQLMAELVNIFDIHVDMRDWGFLSGTSETDFVEFCLKIWPHADIYLKPVVTKEGDYYINTQQILSHSTKCNKSNNHGEPSQTDVKEDINSSKNAKSNIFLRRSRSSIPLDFVQIGDDLDYISSFIGQGMYLRCRGGHIYGPNLFYLNLTDPWDELEEFQKRLNNHYSIHILEAFPSCEDLVTGLYVAASYRSKWYRAKILSITNNSQFEVRLIDYGEKMIMSTNDIRYLDNNFFKSFAAQAVYCRVHLSELYKDYITGRQKWTEEETEDFIQSLSKVDLGVRFHEIVFDGDEPIWEVTLDALDSYFTNSIIMHNIEQQIIRRSQGYYYYHKEDGTLQYK